jgi:hypothetical protein
MPGRPMMQPHKFATVVQCVCPLWADAGFAANDGAERDHGRDGDEVRGIAFARQYQ